MAPQRKAYVATLFKRQPYFAVTEGGRHHYVYPEPVQLVRRVLARLQFGNGVLAYVCEPHEQDVGIPLRMHAHPVIQAGLKVGLNKDTIVTLIYDSEVCAYLNERPKEGA